MEPKSRFFRYFFENVAFAKFAKNHRKNNGVYWFFELRAFKNPIKIDTEIVFENNFEKNIQKINFGIHFGLPKTFKILQNRPEKRRGTEPVSRRYATRQEVAGRQRKSSFVKRPNG